MAGLTPPTRGIRDQASHIIIEIKQQQLSCSLHSNCEQGCIDSGQTDRRTIDYTRRVPDIIRVPNENTTCEERQVAEEQTVKQHLPYLQVMAPLNMGSANRRTTSKSLTDNKLTTKEQEVKGQSQYLGCKKAHTGNMKYGGVCAQTSHPLAELILQCVS